MNESNTEPSRPLRVPTRINPTCDAGEDMTDAPGGGGSRKAHPNRTNPFMTVGGVRRGRQERQTTNTANGRTRMVVESNPPRFRR